MPLADRFSPFDLGQIGIEPVQLGREHIISALGGLAAWELAGRLLKYSFLPSFSAAARAAWELIATGEIAGPLAASLGTLLVGFGLSAGLGLMIGTLMGRYLIWEHLLSIYVDALLAAPGLIFVPILFSFFGAGRLSQTALIFIYSFATIAANTRIGVHTVDRSLLEMARSFGASERQVFWKVVLPGALPIIMAGLRLGMTRAVKGMINGEMLIAFIGLGTLIKFYGSRFDASKLWGVMLIVILLAVVCTGSVQALERRLARGYSRGTAPVEQRHDSG